MSATVDTPKLAGAGHGRRFCVDRPRRGLLRRFRSCLVAAVLAIQVTLLAAPAAAAAGPRGPRGGPDRQRPLPAPHRVLLRSLVVPGWGQLENGQRWKAVTVAAVEGALLASAYVELRRADRSFEAHVAAAERGDEAQALEHFARHEDRHARAIGRFWSLAFAAMLSGIDAYVDAHLRDFEVDRSLEEQGDRSQTEARWQLAPEAGPHGATLALAVRF
ncbi:MAG: DUF5683 domain-containing protein [Candidatus Eiseniibacteriota bacterium]|jgi:hypothetical protein